MTTKQDFLKNIRESLQAAHIPAARATLPTPPWAFATMTREERIASFEREITPLRGVAHMAHTREEAVSKVMALLAEQDSTEILAWDDDQLPIPELGAALRNAGYRTLDATVPRNPAAQRAKLHELARAGVGITGALAGFADSGTLALASGAGRPRLASLLPPVHIALLDVAELYDNQPAFWAAHPDAAAQGANLIFITGPSRTADIELIPTFGVHGPKQLHAIILNLLDCETSY